MIDVSYVQVCGVAPADRIEGPVTGVLQAVGFRVAIPAKETRVPTPCRIPLIGPFAFQGRTPHDSKSLTGLRGSKRYTVRRESRGQFLNNPCGWLNLQAEGLGKPNMRVRINRGGAYLS